MYRRGTELGGPDIILDEAQFHPYDIVPFFVLLHGQRVFSYMHHKCIVLRFYYEFRLIVPSDLDNSSNSLCVEFFTSKTNVKSLGGAPHSQKFLSKNF